MSRRMFTRTMNGELSTQFRSSGAQDSLLGVNVAIFGNTGFIGRHVVEACGWAGYTTLLPFRFRAGLGSGVRQTRCLNEGLTGQHYETDFEIDKEFVVKSVLDKVDNVINCIGAWQEPAVYENSQSWFSMEAINVEWPRMLARWSRELGILKFTHVSMVGADVNSPSKLLRQKALAEQAVLEEFPTACIIRATDAYAEDDRTYSRYLKAQNMWKVTPVPNGGLRIHQPVFAGDVAEAVSRSLLLDHTDGRIAELGGPVRFTTNDILRWAAAANNLPHMTVHIPKWVWRAGARVYERFPVKKGMLLGSPAPVWNKDWVERQFIDNCAMPERDPELLDWEDFGIPREDLYRLEEKYFLSSIIWSKSQIWLNNADRL